MMLEYAFLSKNNAKMNMKPKIKNDVTELFSDITVYEKLFIISICAQIRILSVLIQLGF